MAFRIFCASLILAVASAANARAASQQETARAWTTSVDEVNTGEDLRKTCSAWTTVKDASGKVWTLKLEISNGDVLPPVAYPQFSIATPGGLPKGEDQPVSFDFGDKKIDAKALNDGREGMVNNMKETSLALLRNMAAGDKLAVTLAGTPSPFFSLAGFTLSYRKLGSWCGFPTNDVTK